MKTDGIRAFNPVAMPVNQADFGIVIGINEYPDYNPLRGAVADATAFHTWLTNTQTGGGLEPDNCVLITSATPQLDPPVPYQALIDNKLKRMLIRISQHPIQQGRFYFYFSGHGLGLDTTNVGLCLAEWSKGFMRNAALQSNEYLEFFKQLGKFREVFFFLDCCRVREFNVTGIRPTLGNIRPDEASPTVKAGIVYATDFLNVAKEAALNIDASAREVRGYFTKALLDGLEGEAATAPGGVTLRALQNYLEREVPTRSKQATDIEQKPRFVLQNLDADDDINIRFGSALPRNEYVTDSSEEYRLIINNPNQPRKSARVTVYDVRNAIQFRGYDELDGLSLPEGAYSIITEFTEESHRADIVLNQNLTYTVPLAPLRYTAALIAGAATSHEYYTEYAQRASRETTRSIPLSLPATGQLFLCLRRVDATGAQPGENLAERLVLLDEYQNVLTRFATDEVEYGEAGYLTFSTTAAPGLYFLTYYAEKEGNSRQLPLYVFDSWQTQVFILYKDGLQFGSTRVFLGQGGFSATDSDLQLVDTGMLALQNPTQELPDDLVSNLLKGKFINPMVGIIGAYLMLQRQRFDLFPLKTIISNLNSIFDDRSVPDSQIINYLTANALVDGNSLDIPPAPVDGWLFDKPPMFLWGLQALLKAAVDKPETVKIMPNSVLNTVAPRVYADSAWASWKHEALYPYSDTPVAKSLLTTYIPESWVVNELLRAMNALPQHPVANEEIGLEADYLAFEKSFEPNGLGKITDGLWRDSSPSKRLDVDALAQRLGLPVGTVQQTINALLTQKGLIDKFSKQFHLDSRTIESVMQQLTDWSGVARKFTLQDIPGVGFEEEMLLNGVGVQSVEALINIGQNGETLKSMADQLNLDTETLNNWIDQAKMHQRILRKLP